MFYVLADRRLLKSNATVVTIAEMQRDGSLLTTRVTAEKNGVKPPMSAGPQRVASRRTKHPQGEDSNGSPTAGLHSTPR
jgi:hypothetical protein